jgi:catechol 2,3-dioxygenase-like lactoylglutathione lyase family enzyme
MTKDAGIVVELGVRDVGVSTRFYTGALGLTLEEVAPSSPEPPRWAELSLGTSRLMLQAHDDLKSEVPNIVDEAGKASAVVVLRMTVEDARRLHDDLAGSASSLVETDYGTVEFTLSDPDGYALLVAGR